MPLLKGGLISHLVYIRYLGKL